MSHRLISADSHVIEPADLWTSRIDQPFRDRAPRVASEIAGTTGHFFVCEELRPFPVAGFAIAGVDPRIAGDKLLDGYDAVPAGASDPDARLRDQDRDGVCAEVLYPSLGMNLYTLKDGELRAACFRAYNDWIGEFCRVRPDRFVGAAMIPLDDVSVGISELERAARLGLRSGMIWGEPPANRPYNSPEWDPLWAAASDLDLPLSLHVVTSSEASHLFPEEPGAVAMSIVQFYALLTHQVQRSLAAFVGGGVLNRFPKLRIVSAENDIGWMAHFCQRMDHSYERDRHRSWALPEAPSVYFRRQVWATFQQDPVGLLSREFLGEDKLMWGNDFPHADSTWPRSREIIEEEFADIPEAERAAIVAENCAVLYGLD
jgi:predicted TIM-barrel fold metal-dependent hydrolase